MRHRINNSSSQTTPIVGRSTWAVQVRHEIEIASRHPTTVLITGPSGTGKELIARAIHQSSSRADKPFVPIDCAAASGALFTGQLFGHVKGAFTGATHSAMGAFRAANGGTIFLDEMGELDLQLQARFLRTLQQRVVVPVGSLEEFPIDVRVVAATHRDLSACVAEGKFREDLYYRLHVMTIETATLRTRPEDILPVAEALMARLEIQHGISRRPIDNAALAALCGYDWPGNVRELNNNVLERALLYCEGEAINLEHLPAYVRACSGDPVGIAEACDSDDELLDDEAAWPTMEDVERRHLIETLQRTNFNQSAAARLLKLDRNAVRRLARRLGVETRPFRG